MDGAEQPSQSAERAFEQPSQAAERAFEQPSQSAKRPKEVAAAVRFEQRETWCTVEEMKEAAFCRKLRKHFKRHLESHVFENDGFISEPRCEFRVHKPDNPRQRRHFPDRHLKTIWTVM
ncbi:hypothetical protein V1264_019639 [Littorina saxatilis]|uniref:Uncharacterized protein n=1 Tax=Littorina saxatilis TaxID=31220 RepID=A0AAN9BGY4_9CAEN